MKKLRTGKMMTKLVSDSLDNLHATQGGAKQDLINHLAEVDTFQNQLVLLNLLLEEVKETVFLLEEVKETVFSVLDVRNSTTITMHP